MSAYLERKLNKAVILQSVRLNKAVILQSNGAKYLGWISSEGSYEKPVFELKKNN